jgi:flagella basal body P-ring formation protein FlgA
MRLWPFLFISLLLGSLGLFPGGAAAAQNPGLTLGQEEFTRIFREMASQGAPWPAEDLVARGVNAQPATLTLSSREYTIALLNQPAARLGKNSLTVAILVAGKEEGRVRLNGDLLLYGNVVCTTRKLDRHQRLAASDLTVVRREIGSLDPAFLHRPEEAVGRQPKSSLQAGAILYRHQLDTPLLVKRGERVTIMAQSGEVMVTVPGQARDNGAAGERIRVKNLMSRKEISARVVDNSLVETEL